MKIVKISSAEKIGLAESLPLAERQVIRSGERNRFTFSNGIKVKSG